MSKRAAAPQARLSGSRCDVPVLERNHKKFSSCLDWLLPMQFPRRNVDFSNPGLIGRRREEKLWSARVAVGIQVSIWVRLLALSNCDSFLALQQGFRSHNPVSDGAKLHPHYVLIKQCNRGHPPSI